MFDILGIVLLLTLRKRCTTCLILRGFKVYELGICRVVFEFIILVAL